MGKSERELVKSAELIICKLLRGESPSATERRHPFFVLCGRGAERISADLGRVSNAEHIGNDYSNPGDIKITTASGENVYVEIKILKSEGSTGTLANISQDALTEHGIFHAESRSGFLERKNHYQWVLDEMRAVTGFGTLSPDTPKSRIYEIAGEFKEIIGVGDRIAEQVAREMLVEDAATAKQRQVAQAIINIVERDRQEKLEYLNILRRASATLNKERLKRFVLLLLTGNNTSEAISDSIDKPIEDWFGKTNYEIYYLYKDGGEPVREDKSKLTSLIQCDYDIDFREDQINLIVYRVCDGARSNTLRIVLHWKNKFQGIQTPCLNIFRENV